MRCPAAVLAAVVLLSACETTDPVGNPPPPPPPPATILITGHDMGPRFNNFSIRRGSADMSTAVVKLNGTQLPATATGDYVADLGSSLAVGEQLTLEVTHGGLTVTGTATIPAAPVVTAPDPAQTHQIAIGQNVDFAWTSATDRDWWEVFIEATNGSIAQDSLGASARTALLSTATLPAAGGSFQGSVWGYVKGTFTGPAHAASNMRVRVAGATVTFTTAAGLQD